MHSLISPLLPSSSFIKFNAEYAKYAYAEDRLGILRSLEEFRAASVEKIAVVAIESVVKLVSIFGQV